MHDRGFSVVKYDNIIGKSPAMINILKLVEKLGQTDVNVIVLGESGTGKELIVRAIHDNSLRANEPFIPVDCLALPENLLESELFGYERGAFSGAFSTKPGICEYAQKGTIFFDEIGSLSLFLQGKLLRVLQEKKFRRIGGRKLIDIDVRVVTATNRDLSQAVKDGSFRKDLYYRINVVSIVLPPLRERGEGDIFLLANHYLNCYNNLYHKKIEKISGEAMALLEGYCWPGNVRELQNVIERAVSLASSNVLSSENLPEAVRIGEVPNFKEISMDISFEEAKGKWIEKFEKHYLRSILKRTGGNVSQAAEEADVNRKTIHRLLKKYGINRNNY